MGTMEEISESVNYREEFRDRYEDDIFDREIVVGTRHIVAHGGIYRDITKHPLFLRLAWINQLGMHGFIGSSIDSEYIVDTSSNQKRYGHSLDTGIRMEVAARVNSFDEEAVKLGIASGLLHDAYMAPMSEQGKRANRKALDEEKNIELILRDKELIKTLSRHNVKPDDVILAVRGQYPAIGKMLNSPELDIDKVSYTLIDTCKINPNTVKPEERHLFEWYRWDPLVQNIHETIFINHNNDVVFLVPGSVKKLLHLRSWMYSNVYFSPTNRAREAFLERELERLWNEGKLSLEKMLKMNDNEFERCIKRYIEKKTHMEIFSMFPDAFHELARIKDGSLEDVQKEYGNRLLVKKQPKFSPATETLVSGRERRSVPFREVFPEDAKKIEDIADSCEYIGVYSMDLR
jgi:HD superfamily phosphohydrolase